MNATTMRDCVGNPACAQPCAERAVRAACNAALESPGCLYPRCDCEKLPAVVAAACAQQRIKPEARGGMRPSIALSIGQPAQPQLAYMIEVDRRRGTFGLHVGAGRPGPCHLATSVWLDPDAAEAVAHALLEAVATWRAEQAIAAWTGVRS